MHIETGIRRYLQTILDEDTRIQQALFEDRKDHLTNRAIASTGRVAGMVSLVNTFQVLASLEEAEDERKILFQTAIVEATTADLRDVSLIAKLEGMKAKHSEVLNAAEQSCSGDMNFNCEGSKFRRARDAVGKAWQTVDDLEPAVKEKLKMKTPPAANKLVQFDDENNCILIGTRSSVVDDKSAFRLFKLIAEANGEVVSRAVIRDELPVTTSKNALSNLTKKLPTELQGFLESAVGRVGGLRFIARPTNKRTKKKQESDESGYFGTYRSIDVIMSPCEIR